MYKISRGKYSGNIHTDQPVTSENTHFSQFSCMQFFFLNEHYSIILYFTLHYKNNFCLRGFLFVCFLDQIEVIFIRNPFGFDSLKYYVTIGFLPHASKIPLSYYKSSKVCRLNLEPFCWAKRNKNTI